MRRTTYEAHNSMYNILGNVYLTATFSARQGANQSSKATTIYYMWQHEMSS